MCNNNIQIGLCKNKNTEKSISTPGRHKSPFHKTMPMIELYNNGVPKDLNYYKKLNDCDYTIGTYIDYFIINNDALSE